MNDSIDTASRILQQPNAVLTLSPALAEALGTAADALGRHYVSLSLGDAADKEDILTEFARALDMPRWFGANWDALYDCLTDLSWLPDGAFTVAISGAVPDSETRETLHQILEDACSAWQQDGTAFHAFIDPRLLARPN